MFKYHTLRTEEIKYYIKYSLALYFDLLLTNVN